jgi:hypothetical protein
MFQGTRTLSKYKLNEKNIKMRNHEINSLNIKIMILTDWNLCSEVMDAYVFRGLQPRSKK